jgi:hypothetical protein
MIIDYSRIPVFAGMSSYTAFLPHGRKAIKHTPRTSSGQHFNLLLGSEPEKLIIGLKIAVLGSQLF